MINILLVEDDKSFGYVLSEYMKLKNYNVTWKETASEAIDELLKFNYDLAVLDVNLKNSTGYQVANVIKENNLLTSFIFLTARDLKIDQLKGYQLGAEEYVTKPIDEEILLAKIDAILTRKKHKNHQTIELVWQDVNLNINKRELVVGTSTFQLTEKESLLMQSLISQPQELVKRKMILQNIWENQDEFSRNSMDVYISRLRKYLSNSKVTIRNVHSKGFILE